MTSVRLWLGWRAGPYAKDDAGWNRFITHLATTFIPASWQVMRAHGLLAYMPSVLSAAPGGGLPEEIALLCYTTPEAYDSRKKTVTGRSYSMMHEAIFDFATDGRQSKSDWAGSATQIGRPARRMPQSDGLDFDDPAARLHLLLLRHPATTALHPTQLWQAMSSQRGGMAAWCQPGYTVLWIASDAALREDEIAPQLIDLLTGSSTAAFHQARPAPPIDEARGVPLVEQASWHFHL